MELQRAIFREERWFVGDGPPSAATLSRQLRSLDADESLMVVAARGAKLCAWLEVHRLQPVRLRHVAVLTVAVASAFRRQGLGRALLVRAYPWARRVGVEKIGLNVRSGNSAARALYESEGFEVEGREQRHIRGDDGYEDNILMALFIESQAVRRGR